MTAAGERVARAMRGSLRSKPTRRQHNALSACAALIAVVPLMLLATGQAVALVRGPRCAYSTTFYVDAQSGSDSNCGTSPTAPWRTVAHVNWAHEPAGSSVLFRAGEAVLWGRAQYVMAKSRITYGSYGGGQAVIPAHSPGSTAFWLAGTQHVEIENLYFQGVGAAVSEAPAILSSDESPHGSNYVTISHCTMTGWYEGIQAGYGDSHWTIVHIRINRTASNGILFDRDDGSDGGPSYGGHELDVLDSVITNTGEDAPAGVPAHAIYDNSVDSRIIGNKIINFQTDGISLRFRGSFVSHNYIANGNEGIGFYEMDSIGSTTRISDNRIVNTTAAGIMICGISEGCAQPLERFVILGNVLVQSSGVAMNLQPAVGGYRVSRNVLIHH